MPPAGCWLLKHLLCPVSTLTLLTDTVMMRSLMVSNAGLNDLLFDFKTCYSNIYATFELT